MKKFLSVLALLSLLLSLFAGCANANTNGSSGTDASTGTSATDTSDADTSAADTSAADTSAADTSAADTSSTGTPATDAPKVEPPLPEIYAAEYETDSDKAVAYGSYSDAYSYILFCVAPKILVGYDENKAIQYAEAYNNDGAAILSALNDDGKNEEAFASMEAFVDAYMRNSVTMGYGNPDAFEIYVIPVVFKTSNVLELHQIIEQAAPADVIKNLTVFVEGEDGENGKPLCTTCYGTKQITCPTCNGAGEGEGECNMCNGTGYATVCTHCHGTGVLYEAGEACMACINGTEEEVCSVCGGSGYLREPRTYTCTFCQGSGKPSEGEICDECNGTGKLMYACMDCEGGTIPCPDCQ